MRVETSYDPEKMEKHIHIAISMDDVKKANRFREYDRCLKKLSDILFDLKELEGSESIQDSNVPVLDLDNPNVQEYFRESMLKLLKEETNGGTNADS